MEELGRPWVRRVAAGMGLADIPGPVGPLGPGSLGAAALGWVGMDALGRRADTWGLEAALRRNFALNTGGDLWLPERKEWVLEIFSEVRRPQSVCV